MVPSRSHELIHQQICRFSGSVANQTAFQAVGSRLSQALSALFNLTTRFNSSGPGSVSSSAARAGSLFPMRKALRLIRALEVEIHEELRPSQ